MSCISWGKFPFGFWQKADIAEPDNEQVSKPITFAKRIRGSKWPRRQKSFLSNARREIQGNKANRDRGKSENTATLSHGGVSKCSFNERTNWVNA